MAKRSALMLVLFFVLGLSVTSAFATQLFISTTGNDTTGDGSIGSPFASLRRAFNWTQTIHAQPGDTVSFRAGTYTTDCYINGDGYCPYVYGDHDLLGGNPDAYITINSYDGDYAAQFPSGVHFVRALKYLKIIGLDRSHPSGDGDPINVTSGCDDPVGIWSDYSKRSNHIEITRCKIHDTGGWGQLKLQQSDYITVQDCEIYNSNPSFTYSPYIGTVWIEHSTFRRNFFHDSPSGAMMVKGGAMYNVMEDNVAVNLNSTYSWAIMTGNGTRPEFANPNAGYESEYTVIRNNIINKGNRVGYSTWGTTGWVYVYNNLFEDCAGSYAGYSYITQISPGGESHNGNWTRHVYVFNNIFWDPQGDMQPYGWAQGGSGWLDDFETGYNCYWNQGNQMVLDSSGFANPYTETGAKIGDPHLTMTGTPATRRTGSTTSGRRGTASPTRCSRTRAPARREWFPFRG